METPLFFLILLSSIQILKRSLGLAELHLHTPFMPPGYNAEAMGKTK